MDFRLFVDALLTGTPFAILIAAVGVIWQVVYTCSRDRLRPYDAMVGALVFRFANLMNGFGKGH